MQMIISMLQAISGAPSTLIRVEGELLLYQDRLTTFIQNNSIRYEFAMGKAIRDLAISDTPMGMQLHWITTGI